MEQIQRTRISTSQHFRRQKNVKAKIEHDWHGQREKNDKESMPSASLCKDVC